MTEFQKYLFIGVAALLLLLLQLILSLNKSRFLGLTLPLVSFAAALIAVFWQNAGLLSGPLPDVLRFIWLALIYNAGTIVFTLIYVFCRRLKANVRLKKDQRKLARRERRANKNRPANRPCHDVAVNDKGASAADGAKTDADADDGGATVSR